MSILNAPAAPATPCATAARLRSQARGIHAALVRAFNDGAKSFWTNPNATPQQIAECLGTDGKELFQLHAKIGELLAQVSPAAITEGAAVVGQFTYTQDGRVVVQAPTPLP